MSVQILLRRGTAAQWTSANPILAAGEPGVETDTGKFKIGDGSQAWVALPYAVGEIPTDINQLDDADGLIPTDVNQLLDADGLIPTRTSDLINDSNFLSGVTWLDVTGKPEFAAVASSGDYSDLSNTPTIPSSLSDFGVDSDGLLGQVLTSNGNGTFSFETPATVPNELDDLADVNIIGAVDGELLRYNGTSWTNGPFPPDNDTKYAFSIAADPGTGGASVILSGTDSTTDSFKIVPGTGITVAAAGDSVFINRDTGNIGFEGDIINNLQGPIQLVTADSRIVLGNPVGTTVVVTDAAGAGGVVTMSFEEEPIPPFAVGSTISVTGMTPISYNGEYTVATCTTTQVTFNGPGTGTPSVFGTIFGSKIADNGTLSVNMPYYEAGRPSISINQWHENAGTMNVQFTRARGSNAAPEVLLTGDSIGGFTAFGRGNTGFAVGGSIGFTVEGSVVGNAVPTKIQFATNNGTAFGLRAEISPAGQLKVNSITSLSGNLTLNSNGGTVALPAGTTVGGVTIGTINLKGIVNEVANLPPTGNVTGDAYVVRNVGAGGPASLHVWSGTTWVDLGDFQGPTGAGVPTGGAPGQVLTKSGGGDFETSWVTPFDGNYGSLNGLPTFAAVASSGNYQDLLNKPTLTTVATTGSYLDLLDTPLIPDEQVNADWNATTGKAAILNKPIIPDAPVNADWNSTTGLSEILNKPVLAPVATSGSFNSLIDVPNFAAVATSGSYLDLSNTPVLATVATTGSYTDLSNRPTVPASINDLTDVDTQTTAPINGQALVWNSTSSQWVPGTVSGGGGGGADGNTTYTISAETATGGVNIRLTGSDAVTDDVKLTAGANITLTRTSASEITIAAAGGGGGGGLVSRAAVSGTSSSLANGASGPINITGYKAYALLKVQTSAAAWVRIYTSEAARQADAARTEGTDPLPGSGVLAEVITTGAETILISPGTFGFNDETVVTTNIPVRVTNKSGSTQAITVTLTAIQLEA